MQLETRYSKLEILESYLNTIYLGENYYGVKTAAYGFFGKDDLSTLSLRECAMLAGVTTNPYYYNPRRNVYLRQSETTDYTSLSSPSRRKFLALALRKFSDCYNIYNI